MQTNQVYDAINDCSTEYKLGKYKADKLSTK